MLVNRAQSYKSVNPPTFTVDFTSHLNIEIGFHSGDMADTLDLVPLAWSLNLASGEVKENDIMVTSIDVEFREEEPITLVLNR